MEPGEGNRRDERSAVPRAEVEVTRVYEFDAAHQLLWHPGKCRNLHGHTYRLEVSVAGSLDERGVVMDFAELDVVVREHVLGQLDHRLLNDVLDNPTAERVAGEVWSRLTAAGLRLVELRLWETPRSSVRLSVP
jgi:6-pyruvoyltetrahydropterin/6-carboxytetrahydropterin synthase